VPDVAAPVALGVRSYDFIDGTRVPKESRWTDSPPSTARGTAQTDGRATGDPDPDARRQGDGEYEEFLVGFDPRGESWAARWGQRRKGRRNPRHDDGSARSGVWRMPERTSENRVNDVRHLAPRVFPMEGWGFG